MPRTTHLSAFFETIQAPVTLDFVTPVQDRAYQVQGNRFFFPERRTIIGQFVAGVALTIAQLDSATLLLNGRPNIYPPAGAAPNATMSALDWKGPNGVSVPGLEGLGLLMTIGGVANSAMYGALWHTGGTVATPPGEIRTVHATAASVGALGVWGTVSALTFDTTLSRGRYAVVGMAAVGANLLLGRLVFPNQVDCPGCLCADAFTEYQLPYFRNGSIGQWGTFDNYNPPQLEVLGYGTTTTQDVFLDLVQVG